MNRTNDKRQILRTMVAVAVFCAMAYIVQFVFRIPVLFLTFDAKDAVMTIGAMVFGPLWGLVITFLVTFLELLANVSGTGFIGFIMNFLSSAAFVCVSAWIYRYKRTMTGAILGLFTGVVVMTAAMLLMNLLLTPLYTGQSIDAVMAMIPTILLPFNLTKALMNAGLVLVLYKPISMALKKAKVLKGDPGTFRFDKVTVIVLVGGLLLIAACVFVFLRVIPVLAGVA